MPKAADLLVALGSLAIGAAGVLGVFALSLGMNAQVEKTATEPVAVIATAAMETPTKRTGPARPERSQPVRKARAAAPSPSPLLSASLGGLDFGLGSAADGALSDATAALVGDLGAVTLDASAVQDAPVATTRTPPSFPARARALGQSGSVTLSFVVDVDGSVQDVAVVESEPAGVLDDGAISAVRTWRFQPGRQDGNPVAVRVRQTLAFELE